MYLKTLLGVRAGLTCFISPVIVFIFISSFPSPPPRFSLSTHQNEGQLHDDDSDFILNDASVSSMYADVTVSTDASGSRTINRKRSSTASTGGGPSDEGLDHELGLAEHEVAIRGTRLVLPMDDPVEPPTTVTLPPPPSPPRSDPRRHRL